MVKIMGGGTPAPPTPGGEGSLVPRHQRLPQPLHPIFPPNKRFLLSPHRAQGKGVVGPICRPDPPGLATLSLLVSWPHPWLFCQLPYRHCGEQALGRDISEPEASFSTI